MLGTERGEGRAVTNPRRPRRRWVVALGLLLALALVVFIVVNVLPGNKNQGSGPTTATAPTSAPPTSTVPKKPPGCPDVQVLVVPGTFETSPTADPTVPVGLLKSATAPVAQRFPADRASIYYVPYLAKFDNIFVYQASEADGVTRTTQAIAATATKCPATQFALLGYSQGATAAGDVAAQIGRGGGPITPTRLIAVGLVADPGRDPATEPLIGPPVDGAGLAQALAPRPPGLDQLRGRVVTFCATGDLICATPPAAIAPANLQSTLALVQRYQTSGVHSSYGKYQVSPGMSATQWLANWLNDKIEKAPK